MQRITTGATVRTAGNDGLRTFTISTASEDRDGDVLEPTGIVTTAYMRNPVVLWAHDYFAPPIGRSRSLRATVDSRLEADVEFAPTDFAQEVKLLVDQGFLRGASIGFNPIAWEPRPNGGRRHTKWELLEWSVVPVPANPDALLVAAQAKGLHVDALARTLTRNRVITLPWWATRDYVRAIVIDVVGEEVRKELAQLGTR